MHVKNGLERIEFERGGRLRSITPKRNEQSRMKGREQWVRWAINGGRKFSREGRWQQLEIIDQNCYSRGGRSSKWTNVIRPNKVTEGGRWEVVDWIKNQKKIHTAYNKGADLKWKKTKKVEKWSSANDEKFSLKQTRNTHLVVGCVRVGKQ